MCVYFVVGVVVTFNVMQMNDSLLVWMLELCFVFLSSLVSIKYFHRKVIAIHLICAINSTLSDNYLCLSIKHVHSLFGSELRTDANILNTFDLMSDMLKIIQKVKTAIPHMIANQSRNSLTLNSH